MNDHHQEKNMFSFMMWLWNKDDHNDNVLVGVYAYSEESLLMLVSKNGNYEL